MDAVGLRSCWQQQAGCRGRLIGLNNMDMLDSRSHSELDNDLTVIVGRQVKFQLSVEKLSYLGKSEFLLSTRNAVQASSSQLRESATSTNRNWPTFCYRVLFGKSFTHEHVFVVDPANGPVDTGVA